MPETGAHRAEPIETLLDPRAIRLAERAADRDEAVRRCGLALVEVGAVEDGYVEAMLERERSISTYMGEGVAIPHGTLAGKEAVLRDALSVVRFPDGVDWGGSTVELAIGIAARGDGHIGILAELAQILLEPDRARALRTATDPGEVMALLRPTDDADGTAANDAEEDTDAEGPDDAGNGARPGATPEEESTP